MKIDFIYHRNGKIIDSETCKKLPMFSDMEKEFLESTADIVCPTDKDKSRALIILDVGENQRGWRFDDFCCPKYAALIEDSLPFLLRSIRMKGPEEIPPK